MKEYFSKFCKNLTWNYSESGHGKGAPDGVGGILKRTADQLVAGNLASFKSLFEALKERTTIKLFSVEDKEIRNIEKMIIQVPEIKAFVGTMKCNQVTSK